MNLVHGHRGNRSATRVYYAWKSMKKRCLNPKNKSFRYYGGRGIGICSRWKNKDGFINFLNDMGEPPHKKSLDRIDNDKGYSPSNCRWADRSTQSRNRRIRSRSGLRGVTELKSKTGVVYAVSIRVGKHIIYGGRFKNKIDAAMAFNVISLKHYGDTAMLNKIVSAAPRR